MQGAHHSQEEIARFINRHYDPLSVAESISRHEYFKSEPLIAIPSGEKFRVLEGNRRLTALRGLADPAVRRDFANENKGWLRLPATLLPDTYPVLVVEDEAAVAPLLGFRHISGIEPWDPHAQARYIARLVTEDDKTLDYVAELVGRSPSEVKSMYRNYDILEQADSEFGLDTHRARDSFGVFASAMNRRSIQKFIGAPTPRQTDPEFFPLHDSKKQNLEKLLRWIFGGPKGEGKVITDSRQLGELAKVLAHPDATKVLEETNSLNDALEALADVREQFALSISRVVGELARIRELDHSQVAPAEWVRARASIEAELSALESARDGAAG